MTDLFNNVDEMRGIKVKIKTSKPVTINSELLERFPSEPL